MSVRPVTIRDDAAFPLEGRSISDITDDELIDVVNLHRSEKSDNSHDGVHIYSTVGAALVRVRSDVLVKFGRKVDEHEARMMRLIASSTSVRLPRVHRTFRRGKIGYLVMEFIPGRRLTERWPELSGAEKESVLDSMRGYINQLQTLRYPDDHRMGPLGWAWELRGALFSYLGCGPYAHVGEMEAFFDRRLERSKRMGRAPEDSPSFSGEMRPMCIVHFDILASNVLVDAEGTVWLIDWEYAGVYPYYFEACVLRAHGERDPFSKALYEHLELDEATLRRMSHMRDNAWARVMMVPEQCTMDAVNQPHL